MFQFTHLQVTFDHRQHSNEVLLISLSLSSSLFILVVCWFFWIPISVSISVSISFSFSLTRDHQANERVRYHQVGELKEYILSKTKHDEDPIIIAGDFNINAR